MTGQVTEVTGEDLRFRFWEVEDLFTRFFGETLSPEASAALTWRTGGWAAALQMFHLATSGKPRAERERAVFELGGRSKLTRAYLARNALAELPADLRMFMVRTCTLESLTGSLCDALLETTGSARILRDLEEQQMFTTSDEGGEVFRYHEVLRTHLQAALIEEWGVAGARRWFCHSAALLESVGCTRAAARAYARGEEWASVARLIRAGHGTVSGDDAGADPVIPSGVGADDPWLALTVARHQLRQGRVVRAVDGFHQVERLVDEPVLRDRCRWELDAAAAWLPTGAAVDGTCTGFSLSVQVRRVTRSPGKVNADYPGRRTSSLSPADHLVAGLGAVLAGQVSVGSAYLQMVADDIAADMSIRLVGRAALAVLDVITSSKAGCSMDFEELASAADAEGLPWLGRVVRGLYVAVLAGSGDEKRIEGCQGIAQACEDAEDPWGAAVLHLAAAVAADRVSHPAADDELDCARRAFRLLDAPALEAWATAVNVLRLVRSDPGQGEESARRLCVTARQLGIPGVEALAYLALAAPRPDGGSELFTAQRLAADCGFVLPTVVHPPAGAVAHARTDQQQPALTALPEADAAGVRIQCFGGFVVTVNGCKVPLQTLRPRARSLLRLLAVHYREDLHRETLIDALWPAADLVTGLRRLQVAVSSVRQTLHTNCGGAVQVVRNGDTYRLHSSVAAVVDVKAFTTALSAAAAADALNDTSTATAARQAALNAYTGDLLSEEGPADYLSEERDRLRHAAAQVAATLAHAHLLQGCIAPAVAAARRSVQLDPFQDHGWELLVSLHESAGDYSAASAARREHAQAKAALGSDDTPASVRHPRPACEPNNPQPSVQRFTGGSTIRSRKYVVLAER